MATVSPVFPAAEPTIDNFLSMNKKRQYKPITTKYLPGFKG
jgi:hypothetical protein